MKKVGLDLDGELWLCVESARYSYAFFRNGALVAVGKWADSEIRVEPVPDATPPDDEIVRLLFACMKRITDAPRTVEVGNAEHG